LLLPGLDLSASVTYADSRIRRNIGYVTTPGDTIGKHQPRVPVWRATALASYRFNEQLSATIGVRYSGTQYSTLDNSDPNGHAYQGASRFLTGDARIRYQFASNWTAAVGVENINNDKYWNFHPYPQRSYVAELQYDL
jgi:iron complex outermembrane receptor protein